MVAISVAPSGGSKGHSAPVPTTVTTPNSCSGALPLRSGATPTAIMVDGLAKNVLDCGDHINCFNELEALIDIATFKDPDANFASYRAEQQLIVIYADPNISSVVRRNMIEQLAEAQNIMLDENSPNAHAFAMPASLLHLTAQYARGQIANEEADVVIAPVRLEEIKSTLAEATNLLDENMDGRDISDPAREVTTDEMLAAFSTITCGYHSEINLSQDVCREEKRNQVKHLMDRADRDGFVVAPILIDGHFMLMTMGKNAEADDFKYNVTIANTKLAPELTYAEGSNHGIKRIFFHASIRDRNFRIKINNAEMQQHAANSCGPLVTLLAKHMNRLYKDEGFSAQKSMVANLVIFAKLNAQQQKDLVMAQRSKMIGDTVAYNERGRFIFPPPSSFAEAQGEVTSL